MSRSAGGTGFGKLFIEAGRLIGENPIILIPAVLPAFWQFIAPFTGLISPATALSINYVGFGGGAWRLLVYLLIYIGLVIISQGVTVILIRDVSESGAAQLGKGFEEAVTRFVPLFFASVLSSVIIAVASLVFVFPGLVAAFFLWYIVQAILIDDETPVGALRNSFRFAATYAGETFAIMLIALVVGFAFNYIPYVGWLLMIPTTGYFVALSTLLFVERET